MNSREQRTSGMDVDLERQQQTPPHGDGDGDAEIQGNNKRSGPKSHLIVFLISAAIVACILFLVMYYGYNDPLYSIGVDSAMVPDYKTGLSFNLTLSIYSKSHGTKACIQPGAYVEVFYRGLQVAATDAAQMPQTCTRPRNVAELRIVARASMLPVGNVLDTLAKEIQQGAAVFDLRLDIPYHTRGGRPGLSMQNCKGSRVGHGLVPCDYYPTYI